jgi:hypothetical protein
MIVLLGFDLFVVAAPTKHSRHHVHTVPSIQLMADYSKQLKIHLSGQVPFMILATALMLITSKRQRSRTKRSITNISMQCHDFSSFIGCPISVLHY